MVFVIRAVEDWCVFAIYMQIEPPHPKKHPTTMSILHVYEHTHTPYINLSYL